MIHRITAFLAELKQRRVLRVGAVYIVASWVAIEAADTLFPNVGLPPWTVTLVIALAAIGLPVALGLAWAFELGPAGVRRTPTGDAATHATRPTRGVVDGRGRGGRTRTLAYAAAVLILLPIGWWVWIGAGEPAPELDTSLVAVMPFRVSGADDDLAYFREGLVDLLAATLRDEDALHVAPPRSVMRALASLGVAEPTEEEGAGIAGSVGAGRVLLGEVVGTQDRVVVSATLIAVRDGRELGRATATQHADSLHALVDDLAGQLLAAVAGTPRHRLADLTTTSLPALRTYLRGQERFRAGDYSEAARSFDDAVTLDSTFVLAAFGLARARGWAGFVETDNGNRAARLAWQGRDRLNAADRLHLDAELGPRYPEPSSAAERLEAHLRATRQAPDRAELWYGLGDEYFHHGSRLDIHDWDSRAATHFRRALAIDSAYVEALAHLFDLAVLHGDTATAIEAGDRITAIDSTSDRAVITGYIRGLMGLSGGRSLELDTLDAPLLAVLSYSPRVHGVGRHELGDALERAEAGDAASQLILWGASFQLAGMRGRVETMRRLIDRGVQPAYWPHVNWIGTELLFGDSASLQHALDLWEERVPAPAGGATGAEASRIAAGSIAANMMAAHARLILGDFATIDDALEDILRSTTDTIVALWRPTFVLALYALGAQRAHLIGAADAQERIDALERYLVTGPAGDRLYEAFVNIFLARMLEERGHLERALAAARRTTEPRFYVGTVMYREEGRIAERLGRREEAIAAYRKYLDWNEQAQGPVQLEVDAVRARLARLVGEGSR